jgi:ribonuclease P protein component
VIAQKFRFHGHASLKYVFRNGDQARSHFFSVKYVANPHRRYSRLAVVVSKKIFKSSVKRNRIRRRIYEIARPFLLASQRPVDVVVTVYAPEVLTASHQELTLQLLPLLHQAGLSSDKHQHHA